LRFIVCAMDAVRFGRIVRALRHRRGLRQADLATRAGVSQSLIARIERGGAARLTVERLEGIVGELGARVTVRVDWNGEAADRLLDAEHAALAEAVTGVLARAGWDAVPEVTFAIGGERGSIDILAWHEDSATLLVIEVKSVVPDVQAMLATHDRKLRLADRVARDRGWRPGRIGSLLVVRDTRTSRRRVDKHGATFAARFPAGIAEIRGFIDRPGAAAQALRGLWFLTPRTGAGTRQRVVKPRRRS
jgi:transcriptional regulator with XRE-family HTH domain